LATYLFAWNPALWEWPELPADIRRLGRRGHVDTEWSAGRTRAIEIGSRAFLVRVGVPPKGIFGAGYTLTEPAPAPHWRPEKAAAGAVTQYLRLRLESLHPLPPVTYDHLAVPPFARFRWGVRASGVRVPSALADALEDLWEERLGALVKGGRGGSPRRVRRD
jgi:5-methylcytosine-specific restriction protein A